MLLLELIQNLNRYKLRQLDSYLPAMSLLEDAEYSEQVTVAVQFEETHPRHRTLLGNYISLDSGV